MGKGINKVRAIAFYLPQYHPTPENDEWWGKGFTEWTNVTKAKPLFQNHYQPHLPADLGFYDLRVPEVREEQAKMAKEYGIEGFCYWHYWFGNGKKILERPFQEVLSSGKPNYPFCLGWANESWSGIWHGNPSKILIEQTYPGDEDIINHFNYLLPAFKDPRYITVDMKPLFYLYSPEKIPDIKKFTDKFRELAVKNGFDGLYIIANTADERWNPLDHGCDAACLNQLGKLNSLMFFSRGYFYRKIRSLLFKSGVIYYYHRMIKKPIQVFDYGKAIKKLISNKTSCFPSYPCVIPNWDNSPRSGFNSLILKNSNPDFFRLHLKDAVEQVKFNSEEKKIIFIKSWNEWAEGNHLEPDQRFGRSFLEILKEEVQS
ncbi:glycosyltransferase WbsX family protein [Pedobacter ghigonis]|uniref:glycosyltransferase WbsX family protein n=1 Tax=Pedobacter ghigonis TaxID=2730403 RepID=UPI001C379F8F|nr:glycoside hydrolase family 99-like domain-containing protein [Pedobacter ghigonis]